MKYRITQLVLVAILLVMMMSVIAASGAAVIPAPTATPGPVVTPVHVHLEWGQELFVLCSETSLAEPNGILNVDITGSDNVRMACRAPFTRGE